MISLKQIITAGSGQSSKRVISLVSLLLFIVVVIAALYGVILPDVYIITIGGLIIGNQGLTLAQGYQQPQQPLPPQD